MLGPEANPVKNHWSLIYIWTGATLFSEEIVIKAVD